MMYRLVFVCGLILFHLNFRAEAADDSQRPNVLFIAVDDLRPELKCYGSQQMLTPNLDRLAARGVLFQRAYCQVAVCGASRASLMSGCRPETTQCWDYKTPLRSKMPNVVTLPQTFKQSGYQTSFLGKVYHSPTDDASSWTLSADRIAPSQPGKGAAYVLPANRVGDSKRAEDGTRFAPSVENGGDVPDDAYKDGETASRACQMLSHFKESNKPFFFAVGFARPHLPFTAPGKYWDLYDRDSIRVPSRQDVINGVPYAGSSWGELKNYSDIPNNVDPLDDAKTKELIHGYYASTSYVDAQIGKVLDKLDELKLAENTIVILWGDHGWYLGDFGDWCKHTNYEVATRVPLLIAVPTSLGDYRGQRAAMVELVDMYPTLCELAGIDVPKHCHGDSFKPLLENPDRPWKEAAFSQYIKGKPGAGPMLGTSIRTERFRYTEWRSRRNGSLDAIELIDFEKDPEATKNVAAEAAYQEYLPHLAKLAQQSSTGTRPPKN
ncbi:MAG: sulfatase [Planctomycetaceae bacterium]